MDETNVVNNLTEDETGQKGGRQKPDNRSTRSPAQAEASRRNGAKSGGRPRGSSLKEITWMDIKRRAAGGVSQNKVAAALHVSPRTLRRRLRELEAWQVGL